MKHKFCLRAIGRLAMVAIAGCACWTWAVRPAWAVLDYSASLGADFFATFPGGVVTAGPPTGNPFGASSEWELHGPGGTAAELAAHGGLPASGQFGWCQGDATACSGDPQYTYFGTPWQPGVTIVPGVAGHAVQEIVWTAPANIDEGGVAIRGSIEQMFEVDRRLRLSVFKNASATPAFTVDSLPPIVNGVILQKVDFGPNSIAVSPGDTLKFVMDGSGAGGNGVPTFVAWNLTLEEASVVIPEPASVVLCILGAAALACRRRR